MLDYDAELVKHLGDLAGVKAAFGSHIYSGRNLPSGYKPSDGPALLFAPRGGTQDYSSKVLMPSMQFRIYAATEAAAREAARDLYDAFNDTISRLILYARLEDGTFPQLLSEPGTNWPYILAYYKVNFRN